MSTYTIVKVIIIFLWLFPNCHQLCWLSIQIFQTKDEKKTQKALWYYGNNVSKVLFYYYIGTHFHCSQYNTFKFIIIQCNSENNERFEYNLRNKKYYNILLTIIKYSKGEMNETFCLYFKLRVFLTVKTKINDYAKFNKTYLSPKNYNFMN